VLSGGTASCRTIRQLGCSKVEKQLEKIMMWLLTIADEVELSNKGELIKSSLSLEQALEDLALQIPIDISYSKLAGFLQIGERHCIFMNTSNNSIVLSGSHLRSMVSEPDFRKYVMQ
jgi:hypothetical protein